MTKIEEDSLNKLLLVQVCKWDNSKKLFAGLYDPGESPRLYYTGTKKI